MEGCGEACFCIKLTLVKSGSQMVLVEQEADACQISDKLTKFVLVPWESMQCRCANSDLILVILKTVG